MADVDAVVIGSGPNGLVAANVLADAGWQVVVLEAQPDPGGAVRSGEITEPGFVHDLFSAFYPLAAASPAIRALDLESYGLRWCRAPHVLAHPTPDGRAAVLSTDLEETASSLEAYAPGDGDAWRTSYDEWQRIGDALVDALLTPFPPVRAGARLALRLGPRGLLRFARFSVLPVRRFWQETFRGDGGRLLLAGNALHTDLSPDAVPSAVFGWMLTCLGQQLGYPIPAGGAGSLTAALVRRLESRGGRVHCDARVAQIDVRAGRATAVQCADGTEVSVRRGVLADVGAPTLYQDLVGEKHLPSTLLDDLRHFEYDHATFKVDWALDGPVPWKVAPVRRAGTVHLADSLDDVYDYSAQLATGRLPARPFLILGQMTTTDPSRSPAGTEALWGYTHVPARPRADAAGELRGNWGAGDGEAFADRMETEIERRAPGFRDLVRARHLLTPDDLEARNANLVGGAVNGGTAALHQQLVFRPTPGLGRPETPVRGLFLASASAHPGGAVHGACGANAARAALAADRRARVVQSLRG